MENNFYRQAHREAIRESPNEVSMTELATSKERTEH